MTKASPGPQVTGHQEQGYPEMGPQLMVIGETGELDNGNGLEDMHVADSGGSNMLIEALKAPITDYRLI